MYKAKTLKMKLVYIIAAVAMLAMLIPAMAVPVGAQPTSPYLALYIQDPLTWDYDTTDGGYNAYNSIIRVVPTDLGGATVQTWTIVNGIDNTAHFVDPPVTGAENTAEAFVISGDGEATINAVLSTGQTISVDKKWGQIDYTEISGPQNIWLTWNESAKAFEGGASVTDIVYGNFYNKAGEDVDHTIQGIILNWYLIEGTVPVSLAPGRFADVNAYISGLTPAYFSRFTESNDTFLQTVSDIYGASTVDIYAPGKENVSVVVVPQYPATGLNVDITPEITSINFQTQQMEKVPQVRWAGEKIVLEKHFGEVFAGQWARFSLENQSPGALEGFGNQGDHRHTNTASTVWTRIDSDGFASVILVSEDPGEVDVDVALYGEDDETIINQHGFVVYFLKFESLTLGNVVGKRDGHDSGLWTPENPWDPTGDYNGLNLIPADLMEEELNVSQDALLRARVKGWFLNANLSVRQEAELDIDQDGYADLLLPRGRWVLPDDWAKLAGPNWKANRLHWDIMDNPFDAVTASHPYGSYYDYSKYGAPLVADSPVIGPFSPGIELMTPTGWLAEVTYWDEEREIKTVVPNGALEWWDAPMPPARIVYEILNPGVPTQIAGYFKSAYKTDIYYTDFGYTYTNPFYSALIPAHWAIPAFINNGGYDWDTWGYSSSGGGYGDYPFWKIINLPSYTAAVPSADFSNKPTKVEVYSDNHGEAMVWLNGNWNLDLRAFNINGAADIAPGAQVGQTTVQALADYPYLRKHQPILSNPVTKVWLWGGQVLGTDPAEHEFGPAGSGTVNGVNTPMIITTGSYTITGGIYPNEVGTSNKKMSWVWVTDRDGSAKGVLGAQVDWLLTDNVGTNAIIAPFTTGAIGVSDYNETMRNIHLDNGFLRGTNGSITGAMDRTTGTSYLRAPTSWEAELFAKFWPELDAYDYAVAAIEIYNPGAAQTIVDVTAFITSQDFGLVPGTTGTVLYQTNIDFSEAHPLDDQVRFGDANIDGVVNMGDVTAVERIILGLDISNCNADANGNGVVDMGDVVKIERMILGY